MKKHLFLLILFCFALEARPKSIIYVIADGMGPAYTALYRATSQDTIFDTLYHGSVSTQSHNNAVTDSAAAATALATGVVTNNGYVGVDAHAKPLQSVIEFYKAKGYATGIVVTSRVTHATPASFIAKHPNRNEESIIASHIARPPFAFDLLIGGGKALFTMPTSLHLYDSLVSKPKLPAIVFTANNNPKYAIDGRKHSLSTLVRYAQTHLAKPYFLMVEASQIDWCGHANDIACAYHEVKELANLYRMLKEEIDGNDDVLVVGTSDHSTGGLGIGSKIKPKDTMQKKLLAYRFSPEILSGYTVSVQRLVGMMQRKDATKIQQLMQTFMGCSISMKKAKKWAKLVHSLKEPIAKSRLYKKVSHYVDKQVGVSWTTHGHTLVDVPLFSYGKGHEAFQGYMPNTAIAKHLMKD